MKSPSWGVSCWARNGVPASATKIIGQSNALCGQRCIVSSDVLANSSTTRAAEADGGGSPRQVDSLRRPCDNTNPFDATRTYPQGDATRVATARKAREPGELDQALLRRVAAGDESALASLYDRYAGVIYSVTNRILRDTGAAEEVVQDIFYQLWRSASQFDLARGSLPGWLLVIARNRAIDRLRGRSRKLLEETMEPVATALALDTSAAQAEAMAKVRAALGSLPANQREALELAYFEGLTHTEIADRTGEPLGTVKTRLRTAVQSLKKALNP